jgi:hypothetical protein
MYPRDSFLCTVGCDHFPHARVKLIVTFVGIHVVVCGSE